MKRKLGLLAICLCITTMSAFGQTVQATVGVGANNTILCQQTPPPSATAPVTVSCPTVTWNQGNGNFGSGSGTATARLSGSIRYSCSGSIGGSSGEGL